MTVPIAVLVLSHRIGRREACLASPVLRDDPRSARAAANTRI